MSVKHSLLAILAQGPCYGYQLRSEFERRTAGLWPVNVGQIYNTLERLERDGLVTRSLPDDNGHVFWRNTDRGDDEAATWLRSATPRTDSRDDVTTKVALAISLPGVDAGDVIDAELAEARARVERIQRELGEELDTTAALIRSASEHRAQADLAWLLQARATLSNFAQDIPVADERPRRGRPRKAAPLPL